MIPTSIQLLIFLIFSTLYHRQPVSATEYILCAICLHKKTWHNSGNLTSLFTSFFSSSSFTSYLPPTLFSPYYILVYVCGWVCVTVICGLELNKTVGAQEKEMWQRGKKRKEWRKKNQDESGKRNNVVLLEIFTPAFLMYQNPMAWTHSRPCCLLPRAWSLCYIISFTL